MKKILLFAVILLVAVAWAVPSNHTADLMPAAISGEIPSSAEGLTLTIAPDRIASIEEPMTLMLTTDSETRSEVFGSSCAMEANINGTWYTIPFLVPDGSRLFWVAMRYSVQRSYPFSQEAYIPGKYHFTDGEYRVVKEIGGLTLAAPFTIDSTLSK